MTNTNKIILNSVLALIVIGGIVYYAFGRNATTEPTPTPTTPTTPVVTTPTVRTAGLPVVSTDAQTHVSNTTAIVTGLVNPNGAQTTYWYEYGRTTSFGSQTPAQSIGSGFSTISAPGYIIELAPSTTYFFRLSAKNSFGTVSGAMYNFTTDPNVQPPQGTAPTTRTTAATNVARTTVTLNGTVDPNGSQSSYWFEYGDSQSLGSATAFQSAGNGDAAINVTAAISNLRPQTRYYFRLNAQNQFGTVNGAIMNFTTQGPPSPAQPTVDTTAATDVGTTSANLNGRVTPNGAETVYWFEYSTDSLIGNIIGTATGQKNAGSGGTEVVATDQVTGLSRDTKYFYRLVAQNSQGTVRGDVVNFTTKK